MSRRPLAHEHGGDEFGDSYQAAVDLSGNGSGRLVIGKRAGGAAADLAQVSGPVPVAAGVVYHLRLRVSGGTADEPTTSLRAKMWWGDAEPDYWNLVAGDADGLQAGRIGGGDPGQPPPPDPGGGSGRDHPTGGACDRGQTQHAGSTRTRSTTRATAVTTARSGAGHRHARRTRVRVQVCTGPLAKPVRCF